MKNPFFLSENFQFLEVKFSIYLNRRVFVMRLRCVSQSDYFVADIIKMSISIH